MNIRAGLFSRNTYFVAGITIGIIIAAVTILSDVNNPFYIVHSGSMFPTLVQNDVVVVFPVAFEELAIGDIIVFDKTVEGLGHASFIHRIIEIYTVDGHKVLKTKGDYNMDSLEGLDYPILEEDYVGKMIFRLPYVGYFAKALNPPINYFITTLVLAIIILFKYAQKLRISNKTWKSAGTHSE